jgi:hypothetical protein
MKQWAYMALRLIGPGTPNVELCRLEVDEDRALQKPDDYISAIDIALFNTQNKEVKWKYHGPGKQIHRPENVNLDRRPVDISENDWHFLLGDNGADVSYAFIRYYALPIDQNGDPKVPESHLHAVILYLRYMWSMRENENKLEIRENYMMWLQARAEVRGIRNTPDMLEGKQIAKGWMSMIDKAYYNIY